MRSLSACLAEACTTPGSGPHVVFETAASQGRFTLAALLAEGEAFWCAQDLPDARGRDRPLVLLAMTLSPVSLGLYLAAIRMGLIPAFLAPLTEKQRAADHWRSLQALCRQTGAALLCVDEDQLAAACEHIHCPGLILVAPGALASPGADRPAPFRPRPDDVAFLQFSSGTTGSRKAVAITHGMLAAQIAAYGQALEAREADVLVSWLPLYHDMGLIACLMLPLMHRMRLVLLDPIEWVRRPASLLAAIDRHRGSLCFLPNFAFNHLALTVPDDEAADLSSVRAFVNCSEPCTAGAFDRFVERFAALGIRREQLQTCYAMAEAVFAVTQSQPGRRVRSLNDPDLAPLRQRDGLIAPDILSSGRPIASIALQIRDPDGAPLPDGAIGEIHVAGAFLFDGYASTDGARWTGGPDGAEDRAGRWFATGDLGFLDDGELFVVGRSKDVIIVNGRNFLAHEIEAIASEVEGVRPGRAVAFGAWQDVVGSEALIVLAEPRGDGADEAAARQLSRRLRSSIFERAGVHPTIRLVPPQSLIKTTSGKLSRVENKRQYEEGLRCPKSPTF